MTVFDRLPSSPVRTRYATAHVELSRDIPSLATLYLDGSESSALDLLDPHHLEFEYMQHIRTIVDSVFELPDPLHVMHLGAAGCALARAVDADRPGSRQLAIELDPELAALVREWFDLPKAPRLRIRAAEARQALDTTGATWDVIVRDAFAHRDVPAQLRTSECARRASEVLSPGGVYVLNAIASTGLTRFGQEIATLLAHFEHVIAIVDPAVMRGRRFGNIVIGASHEPFDEIGISKSVRRLPMPASVISEEALVKRALGNAPMVDADLAPGQLWSVEVS